MERTDLWGIILISQNIYSLTGSDTIQFYGRKGNVALQERWSLYICIEGRYNIYHLYTPGKEESIRGLWIESG